MSNCNTGLIKYFELKIYIRLISVSLLLIFTSACSESNKPYQASSAATDKSPNVTIGITNSPPCWLLLIADKNGYFEQQGLNVTTVKFPSGKRALQGMFDGKVDIAATAEGPVVFNSMTRQDLSIISTIGTSTNDNIIVARKDRGILSPKDLIGKRVATQEGSAAHFYLHLFLVKHGILDKEIDQGFMKVERLPKALIRGEVDAISTREPYYSEAMNNLGTNALDFHTPGLYLKSYVLVAFNTYIKNNPDILKRILTALTQAEQFFNKDKQKTYAIISEALELSIGRITSIFANLDLGISLDQALILKLEDEARWVVNNKLTASSTVPNYLNFISLDALRKVNPEAVTIIDGRTTLSH